ncbi:hypothetical protein T484DRAFT_1959024 [Baffinella frigidus]|nr:hypothetical protein T484DRAFT_1959024 [Cryptophyta sp. CCMP2293]|mmetsp:Transcript_22974/g.52082  ORF Transcript_22974/g.52082 Transcript_22974/m.52082 type:complete len:265 (-) Transcript_22974:446-1240(-)
MPEFAPATRTSTARAAAAIAVIAAAAAPGAAAFGAGSVALQLRGTGALSRGGALSATRPCMTAAAGDSAIQAAEPRLLGSRRLHRWFKGEEKEDGAEIKAEWRTNSDAIYQASLLLGASLTRNRIHEVAMGMSLRGISQELGVESIQSSDSSDVVALVEETLRKTGLPVVCAEANDDGTCVVWASEEHVDCPVPFLSMALGSSKMLEDHLAGVPDVTEGEIVTGIANSLDRGGTEVPFVIHPPAAMVTLDEGAPAETAETPARV